MSKAWQACAGHILDTIEKIGRIQQRGDLTRDEVLYDASLRNLQTLSEATQQLPETVKAQYPTIPWKQISGFRNILVTGHSREDQERPHPNPPLRAGEGAEPGVAGLSSSPCEQRRERSRAWQA